MKTFNLLKEHKFTDQVQNNILILLKKYGNQFYIKYQEYILLVKLKWNNRLQCYILYYDYKNRNFKYPPFKLLFKDRYDKNQVNNTEIYYLHKTNNIKGSKMIEILLMINKILKVKRTFLGDDTQVNCDDKQYRLSYIKLLEKNETFYMKHGFKYYLSFYPFNIKLSSHEEIDNYIKQIILKCRNVKISNIKSIYYKLLDLFSIVIKEQKFNKLKIEYKDIFDKNNIWYADNPKELINNIIIEINIMLELFNNVNDKYLYKFMIYLFNNKENCYKYDLINKYIINSDYINKIIYNKNIINFNYFNCFKELNIYRMFHYEYIFY